MTEYDVTNISGTQPRKNMITMGKVDTSDLMMIITWAIDISFQSPILKWTSWTDTTPYIVMGAMASQITSLTIVYSGVYLRHRSKKTSKLCVTGLCGEIHRWSVNSPHKGPATRKMFLFDDVIMRSISPKVFLHHTENLSKIVSR